MKEEYLLLLLRIVKYRLSSQDLLARGLTYSQVLGLITEAEKTGMIQIAEKKFVLSQQGQARLLELEKRIYPRLAKDWLLPEDNERVESLDIFDIYLPKKIG